MNPQPQSSTPEQIQDKECAVLDDQRLSADQILSAQTDDAHENDDHAPLFVP